MMQGMRKAGESWLGKAIITIMFGFLILSFGIWGIGDIFRGGTASNNVVTIGSTHVTADALRSAYQNELQQLSRRQRRNVTPQEARAAGLDTAVLGRLVTEAALDEYAKRNGLGISDTSVVNSVVTNPAFQNGSGQFDRAAFENALRNANMTEQMFLRDQKGLVVRQQVGEAVAGLAQPPLAMLEAIQRYGAERRTISYFVLPAASVGEIAAPDEATLKSYFDSRKGAFRTPEYRKATLLVMGPADAAKSVNVSDADARTVYEADTSRYGAPEKRTVQQIVFPTPEDAAAASEKIKAGGTFEQAAEGRGITDLGTVTKTAIFDPAVADAAFGLAQGAVSDPVKGQFGTVLVRVSAVDPAHTQTFEEAAPAIKAELAKERSRNALQDLHDKVEDQRLGAQPLAEIAKAMNLPVRTVETDRSGFDREKKPIEGIPDRQPLLTAIFASDVGIDNEALRTADGGYVWFDVAGIDPARDQTFDEVKGEVEAQWRADESAKRLADKGRELVARLDKGETLEAVAQGAGAAVQTQGDIGRSGNAGDLGPAVGAQVYAVHVGGAAAASRGVDRVVFKVTGAEVPPFVRTTQAAATLEERLRSALSDDLLAAFVVSLQKSYGMDINQAALQRALGGSTDG